ncbi:uncharacterized protein LODBEIA_P16720 [Lodderomyces beijingensis]|uniref:GTPase MTG2, mitochondrial n=1 Tax=Lodderomyces beijingensis TaxID=1775926 RepID=A0ABP0ZH10_9ASCO
MLVRIRRCLHYTRIIKQATEDATQTAHTPNQNYVFHSSFPRLNENQSILTQTVENRKNKEQKMRIHQILENPPDAAEPTKSELDQVDPPAEKIKPPEPKNLISIADYFSGNSHHLHHVFYSSLVAAKARRAQKVEKKKFIDLAIIKVTTGAGGNGSVSFFKDNMKAQGPADGGDGGSGGDVYINVVDRGTNSLHSLNKRYVAMNGTPGRAGQLDGKSGADVTIDIPLGTVIRWIPDPQMFKQYANSKEGDSMDDVYIELKMQEDSMGLFDDLSQIQLQRNSYAKGEGWIFKERGSEYYREQQYFNQLNKKVTKYDKEMDYEEKQSDLFPIFGIDCDHVTEKPILFLRGGRGGLGNMHFTTSDIRNPRFCKIGREGITAHFLLELKLIADLGLVGLPNAGKSSLLRAISKARPRVGHWEFTTLQPTIGTIQHRIDAEPFTVADIPGIIKGASENKGMGLDFLRHIERSGGLVFVVSLESADPPRDLQVLIDEVGPKRMKDKKVLIVATKADLSNEGDNYQVLRDYVETRYPGWKILPVCAPEGANIEACLELMYEIAKK